MKIRTFVIIKQEQNFLLIRESNPKWKNQWYLPGGNIKTGELVNEGAIRETKEESGFEVALNGICFIKCYNLMHPQSGCHIFYSGRVISGALKKQHDKHSMEAAWFDMLSIESLETRNNLAETLIKYNEQIPMLSSEQIEII